MTNILTLPGLLACSMIAGGCASGKIVQSAWPQDPSLPQPRPNDPRPAPQTPVVYDSEERRRAPWEVTLGASGTNDERFNRGAAQLNASVGYYFNEWIELLGRQMVSFSDDLGGPDDDSVWNFQTSVALDLHLPLGGIVVPYIGANLGYLYGDTVVTNDTWAAGPEAGVKVYLQRDAFLHIGAEYEFFFDTQDTLSGAFETGQMFYTAGFGLRF